MEKGKRRRSQRQRGRVLIRFPAVHRIVGFSRMEVYRREKAGKFPKRVQLGPSLVAWVEDEIFEYNEARIRERDIANGVMGKTVSADG